MHHPDQRPDPDTRAFGRVIPLKPTTEPAPDDVGGGVSAAPVGEPTTGDVVGPVVNGEVVDDTRTRGPRVDPGDLAGPGWLAERRAHLATAPPVIPTYLRDRDEFTANARFVASYAAHVMAFQATRSPLYALRLMARAPRGAGRFVAGWYRWQFDTESRHLRDQAVASGSTGEYMVLARQRDNHVKTRAVVSAIGGGALVAALAAALASGAGLPVLAAVACVLGVFGRLPDKPLIDRYVAPAQRSRPLDSEEVTDALAAIGVKGEAEFVAPIQTDGPGWRVELDLPPGYLAEYVLDKREGLAAAMRRPLTTVWPEGDTDAHPGRLVLWVAKVDPARAKRRLWPLLKSGQTDLFDDIPFGFSPRGQVVDINLMYTNVLMGGVPGSGKTSGVMVIALAAALDPSAELWVYELKGSGDLEPVQPVCHRYVAGDDDEHCASALDALRKLEKELKRRKQLIAELPADQVPKGRKVYPHLAERRSLGLHPLVAIFDEAHTVFEHDDYGKEAAAIAGRLIRKARAYGIILIITTQRPDAKSLPKVISDNVSTRFCLSVTGHIANDLVLGTSMYKNGVRATMFDPRKEAGTGWLAKSSHDTQIVRAAFIEQAEANEVAARARALRTAAGTLTGEAAGQRIEAEDTTTIVDHLTAVWPAGEDTMHSVRLVEALAAYRPDTYGPWVDTETAPADMDRDALRAYETRLASALSAALKPFGVPTGQVTKRGDGGSRKGVKRTDLQRAHGAAEDTDDV